MKTNCPIVTDFGLKEKATRILMSYSPIWLRIGLYIVFGGDSLLSDVDVNSDQEVTFLKMIIEKQFFLHAGLAKAYAYNKMVEGLHRPCYYETLGNIVLKRFLLLVIILDRAKCQSSLPLKYGIDGLDGGSPLLFTVESGIKSSHQVIQDFLPSDIMHGEGKLLAHLLILGYKASYEQYLRHAGIMLHDEDGVMIIADDVANGDKELTLCLLWNLFVHLQLPLLFDKTILFEEICKVRGVLVDNSTSFNFSHLEMLFN
ncbi:hypothetical protein CJ030_MR1G005058 [Morella rubra]|uniref:Uncharacterized protein n=1 Tax=Morella rubra TaxID=262757 RepID=A0A6A1WNH5_9ROSI|nr:hypothetical protein CJ030_MR1G005058 [Morella rubra]